MPGNINFRLDKQVKEIVLSIMDGITLWGPVGRGELFPEAKIYRGAE